MSQQLKQCLGVIREVEVAWQKMFACSCCGRQASTSCIGEACGELFCIMCGKNESACTCSPSQQQCEEIIRRVESTAYQPTPMGSFAERW